MPPKSWIEGYCPLCGDEASVVYSEIHERFDDEAAVLCVCLGRNDRGNVKMQKLRGKQFWDARLEA
ncbi:hypothetical protein HCTV-16_gp16 [Haloarcula virus HCTV-16]|nr:hypothetical protein HCTV-16_gp16 [Haloarcula virus HCTV-16]